MKIATWNVNSLNARLPRVLEFLELHNPDLLLMQETKVDPDKFPDAALADAGYHAVHHSAGRWAGVAIAAPASIALEDRRAGLDGEPDPGEARWLEVSAGALRVITTYVPNGRSIDSPFYEDKLRFLDAAAERLRALSGGELLVAGDFNVCPADIDVYDPAAFVGSTHVTPAERAAFQGFLDSGWAEVTREHAPGYTYWDYYRQRFERDRGLKIDFVLGSPALTERVTGAFIDRDERDPAQGTGSPSDHAPVVVDLG